MCRCLLSLCLPLPPSLALCPRERRNISYHTLHIFCRILRSDDEGQRGVDCSRIPGANGRQHGRPAHAIIPVHHPHLPAVKPAPAPQALSLLLAPPPPLLSQDSKRPSFDSHTRDTTFPAGSSQSAFRPEFDTTPPPLSRRTFSGFNDCGLPCFGRATIATTMDHSTLLRCPACFFFFALTPPFLPSSLGANACPLSAACSLSSSISVPSCSALASSAVPSGGRTSHTMGASRARRRRQRAALLRACLVSSLLAVELTLTDEAAGEGWFSVAPPAVQAAGLQQLSTLPAV